MDFGGNTSNETDGTGIGLSFFALVAEIKT